MRNIRTSVLLAATLCLFACATASAQTATGPNHRYTDNLAIFNQMLAQGWLFGGDAQTRVFACLPAN